MNNLYLELKAEQMKLLKLIEQVELSVKNAPEGHLRISHHKTTVQFYHRTEKKSPKGGSYIPQNNQQLANDLAQKEYDQQILKYAKQNLNQINKLLDLYQVDQFEDIYDQLNPERKKLIRPRIMPIQMYAEKWQNQNYVGKEFIDGAPIIYSDRGERVRSKSEKIIADMLNKKGIYYKYECPLHLNGMGVIYPDFTILNLRTRVEVYLEHFGMMDDCSYCEKALRKIECYTKNELLPGQRLLVTYETSKRPLDIRIVERIIKSIQ